MRLFICPNTFRNQQVEKARECIEVLEKKCGAICIMGVERSREIFSDDSHGGTISDCDMVVSIGGDGAVLRAAPLAFENGLPLLGINAGRLGKLCCLSSSDIESDPSVLASLKVTPRTMIELSFNGKKYTALNDIVVAKEFFGATVTVEVNLENSEKQCWRGDGVILATPTGSSGYNVSAGGPVLEADSNNFVLTPICPHEGQRSSILFENSKTVSVAVPEDEENKAGIYADGNKIGVLAGPVQIKKSPKILKLLVKS